MTPTIRAFKAMADHPAAFSDHSPSEEWRAGERA
jgi:hypothetical protein